MKQGRRLLFKDELESNLKTVDKMTVNEMTVDEINVYEMSVNEMTVDEMTRCLKRPTMAER